MIIISNLGIDILFGRYHVLESSELKTDDIYVA